MQRGAAEPFNFLPITKACSLWMGLVLMVLAIVEIAAAGLIEIVSGSNAQFLLWNPDVQQLRDNWRLQLKGNAEPAWPPLTATAPLRDLTGAKVNPDFPASDQGCASAYGDSFIWGDEVPPASGWIEQLSRKLGCRVANYGVSGYGTDQALIRFRRTASNKTPSVILGIYPEDVLRNVNQYRAFMGYAHHPGFLKGRFVLDRRGALNWIERPSLDLEAFIQLHRYPASIIPHEYFLPDSHDGPVTQRFPYAITALRLALAPRLLNRLSGKPSWEDFFDNDHPSQALRLTVAIADAFVREAELRSQRALVVILPGPGSFRRYATYGQFEYMPLITALMKRKIDVLDVGAALRTRGLGNYCELYARHPQECGGHFGIAGGAIIAEVVASELRAYGLVK